MLNQLSGNIREGVIDDFLYASMLTWLSDEVLTIYYI